METCFILHCACPLLMFRKSIASQETNINLERMIGLRGKPEHMPDSKEIALFHQYSLSLFSKKRIEIITVHTIVFGVAIFTNQIFLLMLLFSLLGNSNGNLMVDYVFSARGIECLCNVSVLYLSLGENRRTYFKFCSICHGLMRKCCFWMIRRKVDKRVNKYMKLEIRKRADEDENEEMKDVIMNVYVPPNL